MTHVVFATERLIGRHLEPGDLAALVAVYGDPDAMRWVGNGEPLDRAGCRRWLDVTADNYRRRGYGMCALVERHSGITVGFCGLVHPDGQAEAEIKYALARDHWGRGFATEAARAMLGYGASAHGLSRIIATTAPENTASHRVLEKAGMRSTALRENDDGSFTQLFEWQASPAAGGDTWETP
jgi:RimJ/RimL family protein N-acetyltransferase